MTRPAQNYRRRSVIAEMRAEIASLKAALANVKRNKCVFMLETKESDGETSVEKRQCYFHHKDAMFDMDVEMKKFAKKVEPYPLAEVANARPVKKTRSITELGLTLDERNFHGTVTRIKVI